jgi:hypothetical protein
MNPARAQRSSLQAIAVFEALKGLAALAGLIGILELLHSHGHSMVVALTTAIVAYLVHALWQRHAQKAQP